VAWSSAAAWRWRGRAPAVARTGGTLKRDSGGWRDRRVADGVADRWAGMRRGARSSAVGCSARQRGEAIGAALTGGAGSTVRPIRFFKLNQIYFKWIQICPKF
jgi:hypothetical protein